jgi:glycosyltransferase involved in cell wall biosynthesis
LKTSTKKVLIITYYWPPSGGSGVQRWLKFAKYLPTYGWTPYIFTPENPSFDIKDQSLLNDVPADVEVIHFPIWEPYSLFLSLSRLFGGTGSATATALVKVKKQSSFQKISTWIRGNFFIPDPRKFWVNPSVKFLSSFLTDNKINTIITTGPPHSLHLIGLKLKKKNPALTWIADFRDPWSEWGLLDSLAVGARARQRHVELERQVLANADEIVTITPFYARRFSALSNKTVTLLTNGFDESDFEKMTFEKSSAFTIRHVGIVNEKCDPRPFMNSVADAMAANKNLAEKIRIEFVGEVHQDFQQFVRDNSALNAVTFFPGNVPHKELMKIYGTSSLLLLVLTGYKNAEGYMPGKLFEYIATGLPIMAIGPEDGDAAALLNETSSGIMIDGDRKDEIELRLIDEFQRWSAGIQRRNISASALKYSRKAVAGELVKLLR